MRIHRTHELLAPWSTGTPVLDAGRLTAVRIEPVLRQRRPVLALDLYLAGDDGDTIVPLVLVDPAVVVARDRDPLIFPHGTPGDYAFALAIAERVLPRLEALVLGGERIAEHVVLYGEAPRFAAARAAGCFGAAPLRDALTRLAPYAYARRLARGRTVRIDAPDAVGGWALLRSLGTVSVAAARHDPVATAWYGRPPVSTGPADVAIVDAGADAGDAACVIRTDPAATAAQTVDVVDPLPLDVGIVFDPAEGPVRRWFAVERAPEPAARPLPDLFYRSVGGSAGRVAVVLGRADALQRPSADTDEAHALTVALAAEGFDAILTEPLDALSRADLIHLVGVRDGVRARAVVDAGRRAAIPVAVHAHDEDAENGGWWGATVARYCFEYGSDESDVASFLWLLAQRQVSVGAIAGNAPYAPAEVALEDAAAAMRGATVVFAASPEEAESIRRRTGRTGPIVVAAPLVAAAVPEPIGWRVGADPFVLVHAPIGPVGNQLLVARAAYEAGLPLVVAGPVADASYLERVREFGGGRLVVLAGEPPAGVAAALRAAAAVVVDAAWVGDGGSRLAASALTGARLVVADRRRFSTPGDSVHRFDPADVVGLTRALGEAWDAALRTPRRPAPDVVAALAPGATIRAIVRGYANVESGVP